MVLEAGRTVMLTKNIVEKMRCQETYKTRLISIKSVRKNKNNLEKVKVIIIQELRQIKTPKSFIQKIINNKMHHLSLQE